ncbi:MAG: hypothetical protein C4314_05300, partial [Thermoflexus sp.]
HLAFQRSKIRYWRKHHGRGAAALLGAFLIGQYLWQIGLEGGKALLGHRRAMRRERIRIYREVVRGLLQEAFPGAGKKGAGGGGVL